MEQNLLASRKGLMEIEYRLAVDKRNFERYQNLPSEDLAAIMSRQGIRAAARRVRVQRPPAWP